MGLKDVVYQLSEHEIFKFLYNTSNKTIFEATQLFNITFAFENELFIWDENQLSVHVICHKYSYLDNKKYNPLKFFQTLKLSNPPNFLTEQIVCNDNGSYIALFSKQGICIFEKPNLIWTDNDGPNTHLSHFCKSYLVDEFFFNSNELLMYFKWHPTCQSGQKFLFLTSNNALRLYNDSNFNDPIYSINLNGQNVSESYSSLPTRRALGDICVKFDFGEEVEVVEENLCAAGQSKTKMLSILLLFENSDIYELLISCNNSLGKMKHVLRGPLLIFPPAEDNYGTDACSILYIPHQPPVLVVSTQGGKIYNCLMFRQDDEADKSQKYLRLMKLPALPSLYVQELLNIEVFLENSTNLYQPTIPMQLYLDNLCPNRYFCYHQTGLYSIYMPWLSKIKEFCTNSYTNEGILELNETALVKHIFCSNPFSSIEGDYLLGFVSIFDHLVGNHLICLTNNFQCHVLQNIYINDPQLTIEMDEDVCLNLKTNFNENSLFNKIKTLFNKESTNPAIRGVDNAPPEVQFKLLCRITQVFREEYIQRFALAHIQLEKYTQRLLKMKRNEVDELESLNEKMNKIQQLKQTVQHKLAIVNKNQENFKERIEDTSLQLYKTISTLTNAEETIKNKLETIKIQVTNIKALTYQLKKKVEKLGGGNRLSCYRGSKNPSHLGGKLATVKICLDNEMENISRLVEQTHKLKIILDI